MMATGGARYDLARFGMEVFRASPRQADLMIVAGRVSQKMAPVLRQIYDQMPEPKWVIAMGVCASSGGMFNNYAVVQGVDHVVPVDIYLPGCPPRPEMLIDAILKLHDKIQATKLGKNRENEVRELEAAALTATPTLEMRGLLRVSHALRSSEPAATQPERGVQPSSRRDDRRRGRRRPPRHVRRHGSGDTSGYRRPGPPRRSAGATPAPLRRLVRRGRRQPRARCSPTTRAAVDKVVVEHGDLTFHVRREHLRRLRARAARRPGAAVRDVRSASAASTTRTRPGASCTPSTPSCR